MDIGGWLRSLGLEQYEATFRENAINEKVLPNLTAEDLKDMGVGIVGHRRMLLDAIALLRADGSAKAPLAEASSTTHKPAQDTGERRQVTVMFSDLVGSTALSARMDPEDLREVISSYQKCVAQTVQRFGGFIAKYMGDGVLVYFGYPQAHEDDAERAVRAGLEVIDAVARLKSRAPLHTRVGIATGLVVVGDLIGSGSAQEQAVVGETPNLAARLQGIAEPNTVVIAESTRKLLGNLFELQDLGVQDLKGIGGRVRAWAALRAASVESRFEAMHATGLTELVGREEELELLLRRWSKAKTGEGQVVLLSGEAGIGKSRLTAWLMERLASEPHTRLRYFCSPQHTDSALYPVIGQMERAAGFVHDDTAKAKLDKLDAVLAQTSTRIEDAALFAEMLSLANDGRYPTLDLIPEQRRQRTLEALTAQLAGLARQKPVLMIFEDAHWTDPTSLETFGRTRCHQSPAAQCGESGRKGRNRIDRRFAVHQHVGRRRTGVFLRRDQRRHHHRLVEDRRSHRDRPQLKLHVQGTLGGCSRHWPGARRAFRARRLDPPGRPARAHYRAAHRRGKWRTSLGRPLRPRFDRYFRGPGRRHASDRRRAQVDAQPGGKGAPCRKRAVQHRCLRLFSARPRDHAGQEKEPRHVRGGDKLFEEGADARPQLFASLCVPRLCAHIRLPEPLERRPRQLPTASKAVRAAGGREGRERAVGALCHRLDRAVRTRRPPCQDRGRSGAVAQSEHGPGA
jgi:class 3 adenylate cyclase